MHERKLTRRSIIIGIVVSLLIAFSGVIYISITWTSWMKITSEEALKTACTTETALDGDMLLQLHGEISDTGSIAYKTIKSKLIEIRALQPDVRFIYLYTQREGKVYFLVDSEPADSKDYSFPGQEYPEANLEDKKPFTDHNPLITKPASDQWGTWVSILVPVKNIYTGEVFAVFGMDYPAAKWKTEAMGRTLHAATNFSSLVIMFILLVIIWNKNLRLKKEQLLSERTKEELARKEERYRGLIENLDAGVIVHDKDTAILLCNPKSCELLGLSYDQIQGKVAVDPLWHFITESSETIPVEEYPVKIILSSKKPLKNRVFGVVRPSKNDVIWAMVNGIPVFDPVGNISEIIITFLDITERKIAEEALKKSENNIRTITDSAQDAVLFMDAKGLISYWNPAASRIFGYTHEEAIGKNLHQLIAPSRHHEAHNTAFPIFNEKGTGAAIGKTFDIEAIRKDGTEIPVQLSLSATKIDGEWNSVGIVRDITNRKIAEKKLKEYTDQIELKNSQLNTALRNAEKATATANEMTEQAKIANKSKSIFLANMSHEIRTPLNAIIGFSRLINRDPLITSSQKEYITPIISAGEHLLMLLNDILELSKVEAGRAVTNPENVDLFALFSDIQLIFKEQARAKKLQFIFETSDITQRFAIVDEKKLRQIFVNLIGNAIKFTKDGGIAVRVRIDNRDPNDNKLIAEIEDSGPGIPEDEINNLFKHFVQTSSGLKNGSGTGLGLILSRELAVLMGGNITVSSQVGKGSVFSFHVKIKTGKSDTVKPVDNKRVIGIDNDEKPVRILVVDDRKENLQITVNLLKLVGFKTNEAVNGEDAIKKFEEWKPDLILMDMRMPVMDGYEASRIIKSTEQGKHTAIIALTASAFEEDRQEIKTLDVQDYLRKPFKENDLFNAIAKALGITYRYEDDIIQSTDNNEGEEILQSVGKIPDNLLQEMADSVSVADLDKLIKLIKKLDPIEIKLANYMMSLANSYDYFNIQRILNNLSVRNDRQ